MLLLQLLERNKDTTNEWIRRGGEKHIKQVCKDKQNVLVKQIKEMLTNVILNAVKSQLVILVTNGVFFNVVFPM